MDRELVVGSLYKHFKGRLYYVKEIAIHSETGENYVLYQQLYGELKTFIRPYDMFMSEVDSMKYPNVKQKYRFELVKED